VKTCDLSALSRYLDGELSFRRRQAVNEHLRECDRCSAHLDELRRMDNVLKTWGAKRAPLPASTDRRIACSVQGRPRRPYARFAAFSRMMPAAVGSSVAAILVLLTVNLHALEPMRPSSDAAWAAQQSSIKRHAAPLLKARQSSAILGGQVKSTSESLPRHRFLFDVN
jgi:anti-sigma factor RsiW